MKLIVLHEDTSKGLNLLTSTGAELKKAFDTMEGKGFFDESMLKSTDTDLGYFYNIYETLEEKLEELVAELEAIKAGGADLGGFETREEAISELTREIADKKVRNIMTVYGSGGWHRYHVQFDGSVIYDAYYGPTIDAARARAFGFVVKQNDGKLVYPAIPSVTFRS